MRIAVLGTGMVGRALAARWAELGHEVTMGTRDPVETAAREDHRAWSEGNSGVRLATMADAVASADVVVNALSGQATLVGLEAIGADALGERILVDIANPLDFSAGFPPTLSVKDTDSLGEQVQRTFPRARVVKTLNTLTAALMTHPRSLADGAHTVFVSGDDAEAKAVVTGLLEDMGHRDVIDLGGIETARGTEMYLPLWLRCMGALGTGMFNVRVVR
jgi:predicted dinucleotide-binding enzyme